MGPFDTECGSRLQALLDSLVAEQTNVAGGVLLVERPGLDWKGASGMAIPEQGIAMLPDDQFNIDSIAKLMTATVVMKLVQARYLMVDAPISHYLPDSVMDGLHVLDGRSYSSEIRLRHLLSHSSGIADNWADQGFFDLIVAEPQRRWAPAETIEYVKAHCPPRFPPGKGFQYSDVGYNLLGLIIERVTGKPLHLVQREMLFDTLGMRHTYRPSHEAPLASLPGRGPSHRYLDDYECTLLPAVMTADWAGGGLISTTTDLQRFLRAFVQDEIIENPRIRDMMCSWVNSGPFHLYGFGISRVLFDHAGIPEYLGLGDIWGHSGSSHNFLYYWPKQDAIMAGTLNQIALERDLYADMASIMRACLTIP